MRQLVRKDNEAYAIQRNMRVSPSKANAVLEMIRGKKASEALNLLKFSPRGVAKNISKVLNSAIANAKNPIRMAKAFKNAVISGRDSYLAGRMKKNNFAKASSPSKGLI